MYFVPFSFVEMKQTMSSVRALFALTCLLVLSGFVFGQCGGCGCPANETDLANGGTFCGNCNVAVGGTINITAKVTWCSGTLNITGNNGDVNLSDTFHILGGTVQTQDNNDGDFDILSGGVLIVESGGTLSADDEIFVRSGGEMILNGTASSDNDIFIYSGATATIGSTGLLQATGNGDNIFVQGSLSNNGGTITGDNIEVTGTLTSSGDIITGTDFIVDGGSATIQSGGSLTTGDDLKVYGGGDFTLEFGGNVNITDNVINNTTGTGSGTSSTGTILICDTMFVGGDFTIDNTTPNSSACGCGTGVIIALGSITDNESPQCDFAGCVGGGVPCTSATLPVKWLSFDAMVTEEDNVRLSWKTASEINNKGFYIERAFNNLDFSQVDFVTGNGNSRAERSYTYLDANLNAGTYYYRLKQVDFDGAFEYSNLASASVKRNEGISIVPNPSSDNFSIRFDNEIEINKVQMTDLSGHKVKAPVVKLENGLILKAKKLPGGIYILNLQTNSGNYGLKLVKN